ncbi:MAG: HU family DNA-binding protein [Paracoccaceae bacterium]|nr:HU family DNA-binding protein [Paracoccaceae bacterium]MDE2911890.1 HU family DNA-binding protein [Paracoccaceae bacterium]
MKKAEIVERVAGEAGITKQAAQTTVGGVFDSNAEALARGEDVSNVGFGRFSRKDRPAREGRNRAPANASPSARRPAYRSRPPSR